MEGSSRKGEEDEVSERTSTFSLCHPCCVVQQALNILFKCLGIEIGTNTKQHESPLVAKPPSDEDHIHINQENTATNNHKCSEEVPNSAEEAADQEHSSTTQNFGLMVTSVMVRRGRPDLSQGSPPGNN